MSSNRRFADLRSSAKSADKSEEMDLFNHRVGLDEAASILQAALGGGFLNCAHAVIFHHLGLMRYRIAALQVAFPTNAMHAIAVKANPVVEILREIVRAGAGLEAASIEEVQLALSAGCFPDQVVFDSPAKTRDEIEQSLQLGIHLNVDNFDELERVAAARAERTTTSLVGLRVNPLVGGGAIAHTSVADAKSKFGVPLDSHRPQIIRAFARYPWLCGLHVHVGSQGCSLELLVEAACRASTLRQQIVSEAGTRVSYLDIGGGLSTVYREGETAPTPTEYRAMLERRAPELFDSDVRLITEFGRAIQANCGFAVSRVEYVKSAQQMAVIHLGADFLLRPVYRPQDWQHEFFVLDRGGLPKVGTITPVTITGPLCFAGDILARDVPLPPLEEGDFLVIRDVGAYTLGMWSRHCSRGIPAVIGYDPGRPETLRVLRPAETPGDVVRFWSGGA
jgi:diaminopimelate decarboxylase